MKRLSLSVWVLVATTVPFCGGSLPKSCQEICCSTPKNQTEFDRNFENTTNATTDCQKCLRKQSSDGVNPQQLCSKKGINETKTNKGLTYCQQLFDEKSSDFVGIVKDVKVHFIKKENSPYINITWDALDDSKTYMYWSHYVIQWRTDVTKGGCVLLPKNQTFVIIKETDGWKYPQPIFLNISTYPLNSEIGYRFNVIGRPPLPKQIPATFPSKVSPERVAAITIGSCVGLIVVIMVMLAWKLRFPDGCRDKYRNRIKSLSKNQENFEYDASILYSSFDEKWVIEELIPLLESENHFRCFIHFRDYEAGKVIHENMADSVYKCRKNLAVVSKNFLNSGYCKTELDMALERVNRCGDYSLIVINLDGVSIELLPKALRIRTFVNLTSSQEQKTWKNRLVKQISVEEDRQGSKMKAGELLQVSAEGCQVISHINEASSTESV